MVLVGMIELAKMSLVSGEYLEDGKLVMKTNGEKEMVKIMDDIQSCVMITMIWDQNKYKIKVYLICRI